MKLKIYFNLSFRKKIFLLVNWLNFVFKIFHDASTNYYGYFLIADLICLRECNCSWLRFLILKCETDIN